MSFSTDTALEAVHEILRKKYGEVKLIGRGQGVKEGQRVRFRDGGHFVDCIIKTSRRGRFSFSRRPDGSLSGLSESDRAVLVGPTSFEGSDCVAGMYDSVTLQKAWDANRAALDRAGKSQGSQTWLAPFHEEDQGLRGVGDGFQRDALWIEPLSAPPSSADAAPRPSQDKGLKLTIRQAKEALALNYDVPPDDIDIIIRG
jgi:hypothetical protein